MLQSIIQQYQVIKTIRKVSTRSHLQYGWVFGSNREEADSWKCNSSCWYRPHQRSRRRWKSCHLNRLQHALLICDAHLSRINEEALITLKMNNIDLLILPAHSTSKLQPLDVGIYSPYKQKFRTFYKGKGGLYNLLYASQKAVQCSFLSILIRKAWATLHLLEENPIDFINTFPLPEPGRRKSRIDYANRILVSRYVLYKNITTLLWSLHLYVYCMLLTKRTQFNAPSVITSGHFSLIIIEWPMEKISVPKKRWYNIWCFWL